MTTPELLTKLLAAEGLAEANQFFEAFLSATHDRVAWKPIGRDNNAGTIEAARDPGRSVVERVTNAVDAVLEHEHTLHSGRPDCRSPREAATSWLNVPTAGLSAISAASRKALAQRVTLRVYPGEGKESRLVEIIDQGIGIRPQDLPSTILSLNESNKMRKPYLAGAYGQGGSSTFAVSRLTLVASRRLAENAAGFTLVRYEEAPPEEYAKLGRYVYLVLDGAIPSVDANEVDFKTGTLIRHWGYDLSEYPSPIGPNSVYGLLNEILFDPVLPITFDNRVHGWRRTIKGSRNGLNGSQGEMEEGSARTDLAHNVPLFFVELGPDLGRIGIEYWVLRPPTKENKRPTGVFANPAKPIVLTINGQNHAELSQSLIKKDAELPYLANRVVCHIDCNGLSVQTKKALFVSNREDVRRGFVYSLLISEIIRVLRSDEDLDRLNEEARLHGMRERDKNEVQQIRSEVAQLLKLQGVNVGISNSGAAGGDDPSKQTNRGGGKPGPKPKPEPIPFVEPPTFVRFVSDGTPFRLFPGQRKYLRIETDAQSRHHNPANRNESNFNFIGVAGIAEFRGSTDLIGGRLRAVFECPAAAEVSTSAQVKVELRRAGLSTITAQHDVAVVAPPPEKPAKSQLTLPLFEVEPVSGPDDSMWATLTWPDDISEIASSAQMDGEILKIYYSEQFPKFSATRDQIQLRDPEMAKSYVKRYEIWLAVHSLMLREHEAKEQPPAGTDTSAQEEWERKERCRFATVAAMFALREVEAEPVPVDAE